mgnify:FL=1
MMFGQPSFLYQFVYVSVFLCLIARVADFDSLVGYAAFLLGGVCIII